MQARIRELTPNTMSGDTAANGSLSKMPSTRADCDLHCRSAEANGESEAALQRLTEYNV